MEGVPRLALKELRNAFSYRVKGAHFDARFRSGYWDGRESLITYKRARDTYSIPAGVAQEVLDLLDELGVQYELTDKRRKPRTRIETRWADADNLRPHQIRALEAATTPRGSLRTVGRGILDMSIRSGKTRTAAAIIAKLGVKTTFVVTSQMLLRQAVDALSEALGIQIGVCGEGEWAPGDVTVATIQTLAARRGSKAFDQLARETDLLIADECHHLVAEKWRKAVLAFDSPYKIGLSATTGLEEDAPNESLWVRAATGDVLIRVSPSEMIEAGYLMRPDIRLIPIRAPSNVATRAWSGSLVEACIYSNPVRNALIVRETVRLHAEGMRVLVVSNRLSQIAALEERMRRAGLRVATVTGAVGGDERERMVEGYLRGHYDVLVGTVFGEGVDIPEIEAVINASGGRSEKATMQRMRNLTPHHGKTEAVFIDFVDLMHPIFAKHSKERLAVYRSERAFRVRIVEA